MAEVMGERVASILEKKIASLTIDTIKGGSDIQWLIEVAEPFTDEVIRLVQDNQEAFGGRLGSSYCLLALQVLKDHVDAYNRSRSRNRNTGRNEYGTTQERTR